MTRDQKIGFIIEVLFLFALAALIIVVFNWLLPWTLPFVLGFGVALIIHKVAVFITSKIGFKNKSATLYATILVYLPVVLLFWFLGLLLFKQTSEFILSLPQIYNNILSSVERLFQLPIFKTPDLWETVQKIATDIVGKLSTSMIASFTSFAKRIPSISLGIIFTIISSFLIAVDYNNVTNFLVKQFPVKLKEAVIDSKRFMLSSLLKMLKAYSFIMFLTFTELSVGLWLLKVDYFLTIAAFTAFMDILPVVGTGIVLVTWAIIEVLTGNYALAIGLMVLWGIITLVRNLIEPKVVSHQIGLHPLATLTAMFFGIQAAGFWGLISAPLIILLIKFLHENGYAKIYK